MLKHTIKNRWTEELITEKEAESFIEFVEKNKANLREANLIGADLREANLRGADLREANLREANLIGADLREANLIGADLREANLIGANLRGADLRGADLREANLREANLIGADLREANLREANLIGADLREANLIGADLREANLIGADLREADLREANLREANLREANLREANLSNSTGLLNAIDFLKKNFKKTRQGYIVYKSFSERYEPNNKWQIKPGEIITEVVNHTRTQLCGCGVNVATLEWCKKKCSKQIWKCLIKLEWLSEVCIPYNTDGKIRAGVVQLIEEVKE